MQRLLDIARQGKRVVLCMDETQAMPLATLETVRLLTNLETEKRKLMQVVLFGQPELDRNLASRVGAPAAPAHHFPVHAEGARSQGSRRLRGAPAGDRRLPRPVRSLPTAPSTNCTRASGGVPRLVNILAHKSLLLVYGEGGRQAELRHVRAAVEDTPAANARSWWWGRARPTSAAN